MQDRCPQGPETSHQQGRQPAEGERGGGCAEASRGSGRWRADPSAQRGLCWWTPGCWEEKADELGDETQRRDRQEAGRAEGREGGRRQTERN